MTNSLPVQNLSNGRSILYEAYSNDAQYVKLNKAIKGYQGFDKKTYAKKLKENGLLPGLNDQETLSKKLSLLRPFVETLVEAVITNDQEKGQLVSDYLISKFDKETGTTFKLDTLLEKIVKKAFLSPEAKEAKKKDKELKKVEDQKILQAAEEKKRAEELYKQTPEYKIDVINKEIDAINAGYEDVFQKYLKKLKGLLINRHALGQIHDRLNNSLKIKDQTSHLRQQLATILNTLSNNNLEELLKKYDPSLMTEEALNKLVLEVDGYHYFSTNDIVELQSIPKELGELVNEAQTELNPLKKQLDEKRDELEVLLPSESLDQKVEIGPEIQLGKPKDKVPSQSLLDDLGNYDLGNPHPAHSSNDDEMDDEFKRAIALSFQQAGQDSSSDSDYEKAVRASINDAELQVQNPKSSDNQVVEKPKDLTLEVKSTQVAKQVLGEVKPPVQQPPELSKSAELAVKATKESNLVTQENALNQNNQIQVKQENNIQTKQKKKKESLFKRICNAILTPFRAIAAFCSSIRKKYLP